MPQENNTKSEKKFNPTITAFFDSPGYGLKASEDTPDELIYTNSAGNKYVKGSGFVSAEIDQKAFATIQQHIQLGSTLILKQALKPNKKGGRTFYLEVRPPSNNDYQYKTRQNNNQDDGI